MRGTPYYYNGDELGMTNAGFTKITDYRDMPTLNEYEHLIANGGNLDQFMKRIRFTCRDNSRTPFQWNSTANGGFTTGTPWIEVNTNYKTVNEESENKDPNSILNYFRNLIQLRKGNLTLVYGKYILLDKNNPDVYAYTREMNGKKFLVVLNFKSKQATFHTGLNMSKARLLLANYINPSKGSTLKPYEAAVYQLK